MIGLQHQHISSFNSGLNTAGYKPQISRNGTAPAAPDTIAHGIRCIMRDIECLHRKSAQPHRILYFLKTLRWNRIHTVH